MRVRWPLVMVASLALSGLTPARATPLTASAILDQFNAVVFTTYTSTSDVEGRTVVGGNMTGGGSFDINPAGVQPSAFAGLTVYGNQTNGGSFNIDNGGGAWIGGTNTGSLAINGGGSASIGSSNSGAINTSSGNGSITIGGSNSA